jgi:hypothetical protein
VISARVADEGSDLIQRNRWNILQRVSDVGEVFFFFCIAQVLVATARKSEIFESDDAIFEILVRRWKLPFFNTFLLAALW